MAGGVSRGNFEMLVAYIEPLALVDPVVDDMEKYMQFRAALRVRRWR